ncbi:Methylenetetrahydrofolate dehydrogenase [NAD(+)] [Tyrophagus putrescentiae]|nr:Methylenetetrahydrofolate dehydrogenase [NAD(+)] [Tyrophagus putrescentiae]
MECQTVLGSHVARSFIEDLKTHVKENNLQVKLVSFLANADPSAEQYAEVTKRSCAQSGITFELRKLNREALEEAIIAAMTTTPSTASSSTTRSLAAATTNVEGLCHLFRFNMYHNIRHIHGRKDLKPVIPCTPLAVIKILEYCQVYDEDAPYGNQLHDKTVTIINRSEVVGRPLAALLANDGAKVYSVDIADVLLFHRGHNLQFNKYRVEDCPGLKVEDVLPRSDIVITGVPSPKLSNGVVAVNFACAKNFDAESIKKKASLFVPTIGAVTTAMLQRNCVRLYKYSQKSINSRTVRPIGAKRKTSPTIATDAAAAAAAATTTSSATSSATTSAHDSSSTNSQSRKRWHLLMSSFAEGGGGGDGRLP